jgi:ubiquinone/menaquinone biosynthesis C-methylase UbiE/uncharacterized protein YbaR (Trm112 family)
MRIAGIDLLCPACREGLREREQGRALVCEHCGRRFPVLLGIPDLRLEPDPYIDFDADRAKGEEVERRSRGLGFAETIDLYYSMTSVVTAGQARQFAAAMGAAADRAAELLESTWESSADAHGERFLDLGCGTAPLLASARGFDQRVGVDIAFRWLVVGRKRLAELGLEAPLVCACAESLPFPDESFDAIGAASSLEVVRRQDDAVSESCRVLRVGAPLLVETPNRWSLGPDPHVGLWAGGWLPDRVIARYIARRGGIPPERRLFSARRLSGLLRESGFRRVRVWAPAVPVSAVRERFGGIAGAVAGAYNGSRSLPLAGTLTTLVSPLLRATARRAGAAVPADSPLRSTAG